MSLDKYLTDTRSPLARLLGDGPIPHRTFDFRGAGKRFPEGTTFAVRALDGDALARAQADAFRFLVGEAGWTDDRLFTEQGKGALGLETKVQTLARALVDPRDPARPYAASADELRRGFEPIEVVALYEKYVDYQRERSPLINVANVEEAEKIFEELGKGWRSETSLTDYDSDSLRFILCCSAALHEKRTKPASSGSGSSS